MDPEFVGPVGLTLVVRTLGVIPFAPLLAAVLALVLIARPFDRASSARSMLVVAPFVSLVATIVHASLLVRAPVERRYLFQHVASLVRVGQFDVNLDLAMDAKSASLAFVALGVASFVVVRDFRTRSNDDIGALLFLNFALSGLLFALLGDALGPLLLGVVVAALGAFARAVTHSSDDKVAGRFMALTVTLVALLAGFAFLFWGQGGVWVGGEYTPELNPRIDVALATSRPRSLAVAGSRGDPSVRVDEQGVATRLEVDRDRRAATAGTGYLSLTSYPGALLFVDESRTPFSIEGGALVRSPFTRVPIPGGYHTFRVHPGAMLDDYIVRNVAVGGDRDHALVLFGPTTSPREVRDQLVVTDGRGEHAYANALRSKMGAGRIPLIALVLTFFAAASIGLFSSFATAKRDLENHRFTAPVLVVALASSFEPLVGLSLVGQIVMATSGAFFILGGLAELLGLLGPRTVSASKLATGIGLLFVAWSDAPTAIVLLAVGVGLDLVIDPETAPEGLADALKRAWAPILFGLALEGFFTVVPFTEIHDARSSLVPRILALAFVVGTVAYAATLPVVDEADADASRGLRRIRAFLSDSLLRFVVSIVMTVREIERWVLGAIPDATVVGARSLAWISARAQRDVESLGDAVLERSITPDTSNSSDPSDAESEPTNAIGPILLVVGSAIAIYYLLFAG